MNNEATGSHHLKSHVPHHNHDQQAVFIEEANPDQRKMSGKFSGLEKMKKSRNDDTLKKEDEKAYLFNLF